MERGRTTSSSVLSHMPNILQAIVADWWPLRPIGEVSAGLVSRICSAQPPPVSVSREQPVCPAPFGFLPVFPQCQTEKGGRREGESSGMLPIGERRQQRKQEKYISLSLLSPSEALYTSSFYVSCSPAFTSSIPPASHCPSLTQTLNPPRFTPHSFLNPKSLLPSLLALSQLFSPYLSVTYRLPFLLSVYHVWTCHFSA